jgi:hypothetical protein
MTSHGLITRISNCRYRLRALELPERLELRAKLERDLTPEAERGAISEMTMTARRSRGNAEKEMRRRSGM